MKNREKFIALLIFAAILLLLCACTKQAGQEPPAPEEPSAQAQQLLQSASACTCLMEQGARWHLIQAGALEKAEADEPFFSALAAMEAELTAHPEEFATVAENTLWLLDSGPAGGLELQFVQAGPKNTLSCRSLVFDGETVSWQKEVEQWDSPHWAGCAGAATDAERQRILEMYDRLSGDDLQPRFWRVSMAHGEQLALTALSMQSACADVFYPVAQMGGRLILRAEDIPDAPEVELYQALLRIQFEESVVDAVDALLLRGFVEAGLRVPYCVPWDAPVPVVGEQAQFYAVRNAVQVFSDEMCKDKTLREEFLAHENWSLAWEGGFEFHLTAQSAEDALTAHIYLVGVDVEGYQTPTRKNLERLAREGENSDQVPDEVRAQFVLAVMRDIQYGHAMAGSFSNAEWIWHVEQDGEYWLEVYSYTTKEDETYLRLCAELVLDAENCPYLNVREESVMNVGEETAHF